MTSSSRSIQYPLELDVSHIEFKEEPQFIFAPYVPLQMTTSIEYHNSISKMLAKAGLKVSRIGVSTRYRKGSVRSDFYGTIKIT